MFHVEQFSVYSSIYSGQEFKIDKYFIMFHVEQVYKIVVISVMFHVEHLLNKTIIYKFVEETYVMAYLWCDMTNCFIPHPMFHVEHFVYEIKERKEC